MLAFEMNYVRLIGCCDVTRKLDNVRKMRERGKFVAGYRSHLMSAGAQANSSNGKRH